MVLNCETVRVQGMVGIHTGFVELWKCMAL